MTREYLPREKEIIVRNKKGKLKTKKLLKITISGEKEQSVQSAERTKV